MNTNLVRTIALLSCGSILQAQQTSKEKAVAIPIGSVVEAKLNQKRGKVKGQLVSVSDTAVTIRTVESGSITEKSVAYADMDQFHHRQGAGNTATKVLAGVGVALGTLFLIGLILAAGS
jgi:hypothetical protein